MSLLLDLVSLRWSVLDRKKKGIQQVTESLDLQCRKEASHQYASDCLTYWAICHVLVIKSKGWDNFWGQNV